jgi:hypothetical protein
VDQQRRAEQSKEERAVPVAGPARRTRWDWSRHGRGGSWHRRIQRRSGRDAVGVTAAWSDE